MEDLSITKEDFLMIQESKNLQQLKLSRIDYVDDELINFLLESFNSSSSQTSSSERKKNRTSKFITTYTFCS